MTVSCNMVSYLLNPMLKHQGLDGQQFSLGPKGERLNSTSMPSRQLASLGLKVKDSNSTKKEYVESGIHVKNESFICRGHSENCCRLGIDVITVDLVVR